MESAEREILSLLGSVSSLFSFLVAIAVLVLGLVIVRPLNKVAGFAFAGAGGGRLVGLGLGMILDAVEPKDAGMDTTMIFSVIDSLIWVVTAIIFYGGIMYGFVKLAETPTQRGAW